MKYCIQWLTECRLPNSDCRFKSKIQQLTILMVAVGVLVNPTLGSEFESGRSIYVPYQDLMQLIKPADKAVLMDKGQFEELLAAAETNVRQADSLELGQVTQAEYSAKISGEDLTLSGRLHVLSMSDKPVAIGLGFGRIGLTKVTLDDKPAPLGYNKQGKLTLIVTAKGVHKIDIAGTTKLKELSSGGMQFGISLPEAVAASMKLSAPGDLEMHATSPVSKRTYDKQTDRTSVELTIGGQNKLTVVLLGNGRQEDDRAILLGESAAMVSLTKWHQVMGCLYTVQVLRRGVRELQFQLPRQWTVTEVTCPSLVRWSVKPGDNAKAPQTLSVRLRSGKVGTVAVHIKATATRTGQSWHSPRVALVDADFQRGYMMVNTDDELGVRGEKATGVRREDVSATASLGGMVGASGGRLYFHWGDDWSVELQLAEVALRRSINEKQNLSISPEQVTLRGDFEVTAVERELFEMSFALRGLDQGWQIRTVLVDNKETGFEYRIEKGPLRQVLRIELPHPVLPEKVANVSIILQHVPADWQWPSDAAPRTITVPLIASSAEDVSGHVTISAAGDLDALPKKVPTELEAVPVGRMASLSIPPNVQHAYSYNAPTKGRIQLEVSRRRPRVSGEAVGLISVRPREFTGDWRITYYISRASARRLYMLADKSLGQKIKITSSTVPISSKSIVTPGEKTFSISDELAQLYDLWLLNLDHSSFGAVVIDVHFERPLPEDKLAVPLVRPICKGQLNELLAVQASEELELTIQQTQAKKIDAIDLPPLPVPASRILAAYRLEAATTATGPAAAVTLGTTVHDNYEIPTALVVSAELRTYLDVRGGQRTEAMFRLANAGRQFLTIALPKDAQLWSLRVDNKQAKPQRNARGDYQVALGRTGKPVAVRIVYACEPNQANLEQLSLGGVELPQVEMNQMQWDVIPPPGYKITAQQTKMQTPDLAQPIPAYRQIYEVLRENIFTGSVLMPALSRVRQVAHRRAGYQLATQLTTKDDAEAKYEADFMDVEQEELAEKPAARPAPPQKPKTPRESQAAKRRALGVRLLEEGRFTLPVDLVPPAGAGPRARFTALGASKLVVGLTRQSWETTWWTVGFVLIVTIGVAMVREGAKARALLIIAVLSGTSLLATWLPGATHFANGAFTAGICLLPLYVLLRFSRWLLGKLNLIKVAGSVPVTATTVTLLVLFVCLGCSSQTARAAPAKPAKSVTAQTEKSKPQARQEYNAALPGVIIPYEGDPTTAEQSDKVLIPYARYVQLWNQAHPDDPIDGLKPGTDISLASVRYKLTVEKEQLDLLLTCDIKTYGRDWVVLGMDIQGLAVTQATIDGKAAQLQAGPKGMVLMLAGGISGRLQLNAVAKPKYFGQRGSAAFTLPPLPGAVMDVSLPDENLELEVDGIEGTPTKQTVNGAVHWNVPLGMTRKLTLRWLPKAGGGTADRTLSASSVHDVYAFHWAVVAVSKITYSFSGGQHDRFVVLMPQGTTLTDLKGTNVRDFRQVGEKTIEGRTFRIMEVRLHRPAKKQYDLTVRWLGELPALDKSARLYLVRAGDVSRESGTVTLHQAGGMTVKVTQVTGGRRTQLTQNKQLQDAEITADKAKPVARYYWPYRPFSLFVQLSRLTVRAKVNLDQLVRISADQVQLLVQASLKAERGKLFGASFALPKDYELLSAVGPAIENFYEQSNTDGNFLYVKFNSGRKETTMALVLVRRKAPLEDFTVPTIMYIDWDTVLQKDTKTPSRSGGHTVPEQSGRVAVQVSASLEAQTITSENLKPIAPRTLKDWLNTNQTQSVQFAYKYEAADTSLRLKIQSRPTQLRVEIFAGLVVRPTAAVYTYRLRYNISGSPLDHLSFRLPAEYAPLVAVQSPAMRSVTQTDAPNGQKKWSVALVNEVTGVVDVTANFALPIDASTKALKIPRIKTEAPEGYRVIVAVQNMSRHDIDVKESTNLEELAVSEQQKIMPVQMRQSLQYVFESFEDNWSMALDFTPAKMSARIKAVVDLLTLTTVIDRNGRCRYEAKVALQNRSEQFLRVKVPEGLNLWSAKVAGQPVKPVTKADSPQGEVLIPLVKTSPGGLPYDVELYFAGKVVKPLNGLTKLKPPGIEIVGLPVMQTAWSLRLPSGYRYMRPGGNTSPVAGTAEIMSLGIEASLKQLGRLEKTARDVFGSYQGVIAQRNWEALNKKLNRQFKETEEYLARNPDQVSVQDINRLQSKVSGQKTFQDALITGNTAFVGGAIELAQPERDLSNFINTFASNAGVGENQRDSALLEKPRFIDENEKQQIARLKAELKASEEQLKNLSKLVDQDKMADQKGKKPIQLLVKGANELIADRPDDDKKLAEKMLSDLSKESAAQIDRKQVQIREQLSELADNRAQRYFYSQESQRQMTQVQAKRSSGLEQQVQQAQPGGTIVAHGQGVASRSSVGGYGGGLYSMGEYGGRARGQAGGEPAAARQPTESYVTTSPRSGRPVLGDITVVNGQVRTGDDNLFTELDVTKGEKLGEGLQPYVAKGTYSLPVTLPQGDVRLDFARPSGDAELSIWAVPEKTIHGLYGTVAVIVALLLGLWVIKIWPKSPEKRAISAGRIIAYVLLLPALTIMLGLIGLLISLFIILVIEGLSARRAVAKAAI